MSRRFFDTGWRPFIGWILGMALLYNFIIRDIVSWIIIIYEKSTKLPPELAMIHLVAVMTGVLGLGGLRTYEKSKGIAS